MLQAQDLRVMGVAYKLSLANIGLCPNSRTPQPGFVLHHIEQYDSRDQEGAERNFALGERVGVMAVVAGSPAQRSGLAANDQLVSVNGRALNDAAEISITGSPRPAVDFAQLILAQEMAKGEVIVRVSRASGFQDVRFTAAIGCALDVELATVAEVNAWADGEGVVISEGIVSQCKSDNDLALVIAHEMAHNLLHHGQRLAVMGAKSDKPALTDMSLAGSREKEEEADALGVRLATAAGYNLREAPRFLSELLDANGSDRRPGTHPATARRLALLRSKIAAAYLKPGV